MQQPWAPQPGPQFDAIDAAKWCPELLYGGARGGGKTDFLIGDWMADAHRGAAWSGILFRRTYRELEDYIVPRCQTVIPATLRGARWYETDRMWEVQGGATLRLRYLERDADADAYQGQAYPWIGVDEIGLWPSISPYLKLLGILRSASGVSVRIRATANPGGAGHQWVKARWIDPAPQGYTPIRDTATGMIRMFIPSKATDNRILMRNDPGYIDRLRGVGSESLVRAWVDGDWSVVEGAYFPEWRTDRHVVQPHAIPPHWTRLRSFDWGSAKPFSVGWWAVSDGSKLPGGRQYPTGALVRYREWYGASAPNVGLKLTAEAVAAGILEREGPGETIHDSVADPACFRADGGPSHAERMARAGVRFRPADNSRLAGWDQLRARLVGVDDRPMLYVFATCRDLIRTLPAAQHDTKRPEDVDSEGEDHAVDEARYACMSRPMTRLPPPSAKPMTTIRDVTMDHLWKQRADPGANRRI